MNTRFRAPIELLITHAAFCVVIAVTLYFYSPLLVNLLNDESPTQFPRISQLFLRGLPVLLRLPIAPVLGVPIFLWIDVMIWSRLSRRSHRAGTRWRIGITLALFVLFLLCWIPLALPFVVLHSIVAF